MGRARETPGGLDRRQHCCRYDLMRPLPPPWARPTVAGAALPPVFARRCVVFRSLFLACGAYSCLLGMEALAVEKAVLKKPERSPAAQQQVIAPPDWAPWSLMGGGAVVVLYSFTIPRRVNG